MIAPLKADDPDAVVALEEDAVHDVEPEALIEDSDLSSDDVEQANELADESFKGRSAVTLTEYQRLIVTCGRRFMAFMVCRQGGKTFAATLRVARKILAHRQHYYIFSRSERQSGNAIAQTVVHLKAMERALAASGKRLPGTMSATTQRLRYVRADDSAFEYRRLTIQLPNGSRGIGLPASPDTCVGITGSMYCDEFALHRDSRTIYSRLYPIVSRRREFEFLVTSTPRGVGNKFYDIMTSDEYKEIFTRIIVDIATAVTQGLRLFDYNGDVIADDEGIERLRRALRDPDAWDEEYLVRFVDDVLNLLTYELIGRCERQHNEDGKPYEILDLDGDDFNPAKVDLAHLLQPYLSGGDLYLGFDQARHRDLSVIWLDEDRAGTLWQRAMITMRAQNYEFQEAALWQLMAHPRLRLAGIDSTGLGERTAERTVTKFGMRAVPINFSSRIVDRRGETHPAKTLLARVILERHQDGLDRYPIIDRIRDDFHRVKRKRGASPDSFTYFADNDSTGHADIFTAKALSDYVAQELREGAGRTDGIRVQPEADPAAAIADRRERPDHSGDDYHPADEWRALGDEGGML